MNKTVNPNKIAVIVPFYNREGVLQRAIESVLNQSYKDFTLYLVDDASTDSSLVIAKKIADKHPNVALIQNSKNLGVSGARNRVLQEIDSEYYALLDSDDEWLPNKLELQMECLDKSGLKICHTEEIWIRNGVRVNQMKKHQKIGGWILEHSLEMCKMSPSSILIHKSVFDQSGYFREDFPVCEDFDLWLKICSQFEVSYLDTPLIQKYGGHEDQLSRKFHSMDYWRVLSLQDLLGNDSVELSNETKEKIKAVITKKSRILLKGYEKHNNMTNYDEVKRIYEAYQ